MTSDLKKGLSCVSKDGEELDRQRAVEDNNWMWVQHLLSRGRCSALRWPGLHCAGTSAPAPARSCSSVPAL